MKRLAAALLILVACLALQALGAPKPWCRVPGCKECKPSNNRKCKTCAPYAKNRFGKPTWPLVRDRSGLCKPCPSCPYSKGWASCSRAGRCTGCRKEDGYRVDPLDARKCTCLFEEGWRRQNGRCVNTPCPGPVPMCLANPCLNNKCPSGTYCLPEYCTSCKYNCIPGEKPSEPCNPVACVIAPCSIQDNAKTCKPWEKCVDDYTCGCNFRCESLPDR